MRTVGEFLMESGRRLAPFERARVGRLGCGAALAAVFAASMALALGLKQTGGSWSSGFRFVILTALGTVIILYIIYALVETIVERSVRKAVQVYLRESGADLETLLKIAEMRKGTMAGGGRILALLRDQSRM